MRVSDKQAYNQVTYNLRKNTERMLAIQNSLSSGKKIEAPSDDPIGNSRSLNYTSLLSKLEQYGRNIDRGMGTLGLNDSSLSGVTVNLTRLKELAVQMHSDTNTAEDRAIAAKEVRELLRGMVSLANAKEGEEYLYSGNSGDKPFTLTTATAGGARNSGGATVNSGVVTDENRATLDDYVIKFTAADRYDIYRVPDTVTASDSGPAASNAVASGASVIDPGAMTLDRYEVRFSDPGGGAPMEYGIVDTTQGVTLSSGNVYTSGSAIEFDGLHIEISDGAGGGPADGDIFTVSAGGALVSSGNTYTSGAAINFEGLQVVVTNGASSPAANDAFAVRTRYAFNGDLSDRRIAVGENTTPPVGMSGGDLF
ncbi:MAG: flagellar hook-associated protein FlgL, partial [Nitrospirae bacterium]|nr:flagellar hook-associated protein FlgL [Nitrospirota bacterium]